MNPKVIEEQPLPMAMVKDKLKAIKKRDEELTFRGSKTEEYLNQFSVVKAKQAKEIFEKIQKLNIPRLKDDQIYKIVDLMPKDEEDLKNIITGYSLNVTSENQKKVLKVVSEFLK